MENNLIQNLTVLKALPGTWDIFSFEQLVKDVSGGNKKTLKSEFLDEGEFAIVDQGQSLVAGYTNNRSLLVKAPPPYIVFGDHTRALKYIDLPFAMGADGTKVLKSINDETVNGKYLYYFFLTLNIPNTGYNRHFKYLKSVKIPLPPLAEQKQIAAILDAADSLRQKDQQLVEHYTALSQSLFLEMFGEPISNPRRWEKAPLEKLVASVIDCPHSTPKWTDNGIVAVRTSNLTQGGWLWDDKRFVSEQEFHERSKRAYVKSGDIILSREGTIGVSAIVTDEMKICLGQRLVQLIPNLEIANNHYLLYLLLYELAPERIGRVMVGATSKHLNVKELRSLMMINPPIELQNQFAERITIIEKQKQQAQTNLHKSEALFNSLLQRAFTGELTANKAA